MERYVFLDTETTGTEENDRICEIAWIEFDQHLQEIGRVQSLIDPEIPISPSAMGVHHITNEAVADQPTIREFLDVVIPGHFRESDEVVMFAHNAQFDRRFVQPYLPVIEDVCTLRLARFFWPDVENHKMQTLRYTFGLEGGEGAHGALEDCETGIALLRFMCQERGKTLEDLREMCRHPMPVHRIYYGKHKGALLKDIPRGYRVWMLGTDLDPDLRYSLENL